MDELIDTEIQLLMDDMAEMPVFPTSLPSVNKKKVVLQHTQTLKKIKGKKRKVNPAFVPSIRVFKRDIRRKYMEMYNNVINNHDVVLLEKFLREFCVPHCQYLVTVPRSSRPDINIIERSGILDILYGIVQFYIKFPDSVYQMGDAQIHVTYQQPGSYIVSVLKLQGTRVFEEENDSIAQLATLSQRTENESDDSDGLSVASSLSAPVIETKHDEVINASTLLPPSAFELCNLSDALVVNHIMPRLQSLHLMPLPCPRNLTADGSLTMDLDANHRIEALRFEVQLLRETDWKFD